MDHNKDGNDIKQTPSCSQVPMNEETGEREQETYEHRLQHYRIIEEFFASDEESDESNGSVCSDKSVNQPRVDNLENVTHNHSFREHLHSIPCFYDFNEKVSNLLDKKTGSDKKYVLEDCEKEAIRKLDEVCLNSDSSQCPRSIENDLEKPGMSSDLADVSDCSPSKENKKPSFRIKKSNSFYPEYSDHPNPTLESLSSEKDDTVAMSSQHIPMSRYPNFSTNPNIETSPLKSCRSSNVGTYSMISALVGSKDINLGNAQTSLDTSNSNTLHSPAATNSENSKTLTGLFSRSCEFPTSSKHNIQRTGYCQKSNTCTTPNNSIKKAAEAFIAPNSKNLRGPFSSSWELPTTSNHNTWNTEEFRQSTACSRYYSNITIESAASSLDDIPSTSMKTPQRSSENHFLILRHTKSARKLNFDDSDTSSDDAKEKFAVEKEPRKRKKTKGFHLSDSSENHSTLPKTDNDENISGNEYSSPSSGEKCQRKSLKLDETASARNALYSEKILNTEKNETRHPSRKRLNSNSKASSDIDKSDRDNKKSKKLKQCASSD